MVKQTQQIRQVKGRFTARLAAANACVVLSALAPQGAQAQAFTAPEAFVAYNFADPALPYPNQTVSVSNPADWVSASGASATWGYSRRTRSYVVDVAGGQASARGRATFGTAKIGLEANGPGYSPYVWAGWTDAVTFSSGPTGTVGVVAFNLDYDWLTERHPLAASGGTAYASSTAYVDLNLIPATSGVSQYASWAEKREMRCTAAGVCTDTLAGNPAYYQGGSAPLPVSDGHTATLYVQVEFGRPYWFTVGINASAYGLDSGLSVDATHSLNWGGIASVQDAAGQALPIEVTSLSGFNYAAAVPVPEPATAGLWGLGLLASLGGRAARRRSAGCVRMQRGRVERTVGPTTHT